MINVRAGRRPATPAMLPLLSTGEARREPTPSAAKRKRHSAVQARRGASGVDECSLAYWPLDRREDRGAERAPLSSCQGPEAEKLGLGRSRPKKEPVGSSG